MAVIRLDKFISAAAALSRSEARLAIMQGRASVNGQAAKSADMKISSDADAVFLDEKQIFYEKFCYVMLNKPMGVLSATEDKNQDTVLELLPEELRSRSLFPVGRLDKDTTGLLILTNDGQLSHRITSPRNEIKKLYLAQLDDDITDEDIAAFESGISLRDGTKCRPATLEKMGECACAVTLGEGKYHQVKRMLASRGRKVLSLHRKSIGGLELDDNLDFGEFRLISVQEIEKVFV